MTVMYGDVSALYDFWLTGLRIASPKWVKTVRRKHVKYIDDTVALFCDCVMLNSMYDIFLVAIEEVHATSTLLYIRIGWRPQQSRFR